MKKTSRICLVLLVLAFLSANFSSCSGFERVSIKEPTKAICRFDNGGEDDPVTSVMNDADLKRLAAMFNGKFLSSDSPSCGFTEKVSVTVDSVMTFCIANDTCPIIYYKERDRYFALNETEYFRLCEILSKYGFHFPCV